MPDILPTPKIYSSTIYNFLACTFLAYAKLMRLYQDVVINRAEKLVSIFQTKASSPGPANGRSFRLPIRLSPLPSFCHCCLGLGWAIASHTSLCWGTAVFFSQCFSWRKIPMVGYQMLSHLFSTGIDREQWYCGKMGKFLFSPWANRSCAQHKSNLRRAAGSLPGIIWRWDGDS